ncbi:coiled-coil domain-containing protein [Seonamhaeicola aphaedonensis]|uniref:Uncharacterized protein n=1 Tax=Seonamhaeicola aphaedonensis TaxID=1461338 RepID=A0A3D9HG03_9FLAO|nr:hypothetical protein [Seonamhaeicola aphaedonensis]RED48191.1 hypothetical protein DFQ02_10429 [Seonamhaeicola aphaedonensis]
MEINEINQLRTFIEQVDNEDLSFIIKEKDGTNIIQRLTASELISVIQESITALKEADELNILYACSRYFIRRENNSMLDINGVIQNLVQVIKNKNLTGIESWALLVQTYILQSGIFSLLVKNEKPEVLTELKKLRTENKNLNKELRINFNKAKELKESFESLKQEVETFKSAKEKELTQITNNLNSTNQTKNQIEQTNTSISNIKSSIDKQLAEVQASIKLYNEQITKHTSTIEGIENRIVEEEKKAKALASSNSTESENLTKLSKEAQRIQKQLDKLLSPAIARDLQSTFKKRKKWLFISTIVWLVLSIGATWFLAWYVYQLFDSKDFSFEIEKVIVAGLRLLPIVTVLYFTIRQFNKTRNLEEEYAFRESIATSLMAYADQIKGDPNRKDQLIHETVNKLYESPTTNKILKSKNSRQSESNLKELIELVKELKEIKI